MRKVFSLLLLLAFVLTLVPVGATENTLQLGTVEELIAFSENCRLDSYSRGLSVVLTADLDLTGSAFEPIPVFGGSFNGQGHTISGLTVEAEGSDLGFFRYLTATASVTGLHLEGTVTPGGSRSNLGALAGINEGIVTDCHFNGSVIGADQVGGLVGVNAVTGIVENSSVSGTVSGNHYVGGIAGKNAGVLRNNKNEAGVNETVQENSIDIADITVDTITNSEAINTVTDIGGIAGGSTGVIRGCENHGAVGYPQMGYNIGGIVGSQSGYVTQCKNYGAVSGRKEVGGIVGQLEPVTYMDFSTDTLQILRGQLGQVSATADRAAANAQANATELVGYVNTIGQHATDAKNAIDTLLPEKGSTQLPDQDTVTAAQNSLAASVGAIPGAMDGLATSAENTATGLKTDLDALSKGIEAMRITLGSAENNLGGTIADVSDLDTQEDTSAKVDSCENHGSVLADLNGGGIVGAMSFENDLDPEADLYISGQTSLNVDTSVRCVVTQVTNYGTLTVKKSNAGGIVGWQSMGLVRQSVNLGAVAGGADYAGGIAGNSTGYIRLCHARCQVQGDTAVGGIAGVGAVVTDCRSLVVVEGREQLGFLLGNRTDSYMEEENPIHTNYYFPTGKDLGAIDGVSYEGCAQPQTLDSFLGSEELVNRFGTVTVTFVAEDATTQQVVLHTGDPLTPEQIPQVPEKDGATGIWEGLPSQGLAHVYFDTAFQVSYTTLATVVQSREENDAGKPLALAQGRFPAADSLSLTVNSQPDTVVSYTVAFAAGSQVTALRLLTPEGYSLKQLQVRVQSADGAWRIVTATEDGSYLVIPMTEADTQVVLEEAPANYLPLILIVSGSLVLVGIVVLLLGKRKKKA